MGIAAHLKNVYYILIKQQGGEGISSRRDTDNFVENARLVLWLAG